MKDEIEYSIKSSSINVSESIYCRDKIVNFQHNADNPNWQSQTEYITKKNYSLSQEVINKIKNTRNYQSVLEYKINDEMNIEIMLLDNFIDYLAHSFLNLPNINEAKINSIIDIFLKDVNNETFKCTANIDLSGIKLQTAPIELNIDKLKIIFRQVEPKDFEKEYIIYPYVQTSIDRTYYQTTSAIANVESYLDQGYEIQFEVEKTIAILRLFRVCSVKYISYDLDSESIVWKRKIIGRFGNLKYLNFTNVNTLEVTENDKDNFIIFFKKLANIIPTIFYNLGTENKEMIHLGIAYRHYCEALLSNTFLEEKITKAVIGLESLILAENQEIAFRFCIRGAKILSLLNYSAIDVKKKLKVAYSIRSTFAHGDDIELEKEVKKLDSHYNSKEFLIEILDYLRVLIITIIVLSKQNEFIKVNKGVINFEKKKLLEIVDNSLIDKEQEKHLEDILKDVKLLILY
ncbi:hypothetical protein [Nostoc sp. DSM 114167]|uniref:hypothetical protein n=1 Tax=Nostoc sp. DSM 114167 TaxID=3439050 RepID=UPI0040463B50